MDSSSELQLSDLDLNLLVALHALLATANVTKAAHRIGISQSAMSHTLRRLREMFGDPLLVRGRNGMVLTPRAEEIQKPLFSSLVELQRIIRHEQTFDPAQSTREFVVAATDFLQLLFLPQLTGMLSREAPGLQLRIRTIPVRQYPAILESGEIDLMIGSTLLPEAPGIMRREVGRERMVCVTRRGHPCVGDKLSLEVYTSLSHILISPAGSSGPGLVDVELAKLGKRRRIAVYLASFLIAPWVVASSDYILTAPQRVVETYCEMLDLQIHEMPLELATLPITVLWHEKSHLDPARKWMREAIARAFVLSANSRRVATSPRGS
jgi:DNA-binding transcriptional LysR family regulator